MITTQQLWKNFCDYFGNLKDEEKEDLVTEMIFSVNNNCGYVLDIFMKIFSFLKDEEWKYSDNIWNYCCICLSAFFVNSHTMEQTELYFDFIIKSAYNALLYSKDLYLSKLFRYLKQLQLECVNIIELERKQAQQQQLKLYNSNGDVRLKLPCIIEYRGALIKKLFLDLEMINYMCYSYQLFPQSLNVLFTFDLKFRNKCFISNYKHCLFFDNGIRRALKCRIDLTKYPNTMIDSKYYNGLNPIQILQSRCQNKQLVLKLMAQLQPPQQCQMQQEQFQEHQQMQS